jgi:hypothetical protein
MAGFYWAGGASGRFAIAALKHVSIRSLNALSLLFVMSLLRYLPLLYYTASVSLVLSLLYPPTLHNTHKGMHQTD